MSTPVRPIFFWGSEKQGRPRVEIWVRNTGQTPAKWYEIRFKEFAYPREGFDRNTNIMDHVEFPEEFFGPWNAIPADSKGNKATFFFDHEEEVAEIKKAEIDSLGMSQPSHGFSIIGEIRYMTFFGEVFLTQFAFGREALPPYKVDRVETVEVRDMTINSQIEKPIPLARYAAKLKTYYQVKD